jgi:hypothetical protein
MAGATPSRPASPDAEALGTGVDETSDAGVRLEHVACLGYCGLGPNAMVDDLPVSLQAPEAVDRVSRHFAEGTPLGLEEPDNPVYLPPEGHPRILLRHFGPTIPPPWWASTRPGRRGPTAPSRRRSGR